MTGFIRAPDIIYVTLCKSEQCFFLVVVVVVVVNVTHKKAHSVCLINMTNFIGVSGLNILLFKSSPKLTQKMLNKSLCLVQTCTDLMILICN